MDVDERIRGDNSVLLSFLIWWKNILIYKSSSLYNVHWLVCDTLSDVYALQF